MESSVEATEEMRNGLYDSIQGEEADELCRKSNSSCCDTSEESMTSNEDRNLQSTTSSSSNSSEGCASPSRPPMDWPIQKSEVQICSSTSIAGDEEKPPHFQADMKLGKHDSKILATLFGQLWRLEPIPQEKKSMWRREMEWLLCVSDHIIELIPSWQTFPDGSKLEVMTCTAVGYVCIELFPLRSES